MPQNSPQDPSQMKASLTPAFMNQPQYQQQMQGLAMQVRQQEEGTKKIKKFLKAYEDIQLSAPMMQPQAPQQPGFMQPPGGNVQSMNNNLPRNEPQYEEAPTSFTEMAGGQMPAEGEMPAEGADDMTSYSEAPIGAEEAGYSNASNEGGGEEWDQGFILGPAGPPPTGRDKSEDGTPLEHRGDWDASRVTRQDDRKKADMKAREAGKEAAIDRGIFGDKKAAAEYDRIEEQMRQIEKDLIKKGSSYRTGDGAFGQKQWADTSVKADFDTEEGKKVKPEYERLRKLSNEARWAVEKARKSIAKLKQIAMSKPNKALGLAGMASGLLAGTASASAAAFPPEDAEIFLGRINKDKDYNRLNDREKAAVQKFLEYKAESDSIDARVDVPKGRSGRMDEPIEYSSAQKALRSQ